MVVPITEKNMLTLTLTLTLKRKEKKKRRKRRQQPTQQQQQQQSGARQGGAADGVEGPGQGLDEEVDDVLAELAAAVQ